jgi:hypothetical protein
LSRVKLATSSPERQRENVLTAAASVGAHIIGWADDWEVSGATDPVTRPTLGPWLRDERGPYDGLVAAAVDRLGRNVVDCLNTGYKMRDEKKMLVTYGHDGPWELDDPADENRFTMEAWGARRLRPVRRRGEGWVGWPGRVRALVFSLRGCPHPCVLLGPVARVATPARASSVSVGSRGSVVRVAIQRPAVAGQAPVECHDVAAPICGQLAGAQV